MKFKTVSCASCVYLLLWTFNYFLVITLKFDDNFCTHTKFQRFYPYLWIAHKSKFFTKDKDIYYDLICLNHGIPT